MNNPARIFLSYSHRCAHIARQLYFDLCNAECAPWLDAKDIKLSTPWAKSIDDAIELSDQFLLLWSPEAQSSEEVQRELKLAIDRHGESHVRVLRVGGPISQMASELSKTQFVDLTLGYWDGLADFCQREKYKLVESPLDLFQSEGTFGEIRQQLGNDRGGRWKMNVPHPELGVRTWDLVAVPWLPSGYATSWRIGDADSKMELGNDLFIVLKFTASPHRSAIQETIDFLRKGGDQATSLDFDFAEQPPQLLFIEGPLNDKGNYFIPDDQPHQWHDCVDLCHNAITNIGHSGHLHFFLDAPQGLSFPVASSLRGANPFTVYNVDRNNSGNGRYLPVYDSTGRLLQAKPNSQS